LSGRLEREPCCKGLYREWLATDPCWGWGWIGWSDCYRFTRTGQVDLSRCEQILREGVAIIQVRDRADIADRLADLCEEQGRDQEAKKFRRQSERGAPGMFRGPSVRLAMYYAKRCNSSSVARACPSASYRA
jgi:hypothetical protein